MHVSRKFENLFSYAYIHSLSGAYRVAYMTPEYSTHAKKLLEDIDKKVGRLFYILL